MMDRRSFLTGLVAAPLVVRTAGLLMPIKPALAGPVLLDSIPCDGRAVRVADYRDLFAVIGKMYGGDGVDTFHMPDLRGSIVSGGMMPTFVLTPEIRANGVLAGSVVSRFEADGDVYDLGRPMRLHISAAKRHLS